jgi:hypothetical protein
MRPAEARCRGRHERWRLAWPTACSSHVGLTGARTSLQLHRTSAPSHGQGLSCNAHLPLRDLTCKSPRCGADPARPWQRGAMLGKLDHPERCDAHHGLANGTSARQCSPVSLANLSYALRLKCPKMKNGRAICSHAHGHQQLRKMSYWRIS